MHTTVGAGARGPETYSAAAARVAVAGATGYAGQELLRLLARHRAVNVGAAMSSIAGASARQLPALARVWSGEIQPFSADALAGDIDVAFLALPDAAAADL